MQFNCQTKIWKLVHCLLKFQSVFRSLSKSSLQNCELYLIIQYTVVKFIVFQQNARLSDDDEEDKDNDALGNNDPHSLLNVDLEKYDCLLLLLILDFFLKIAHYADRCAVSCASLYLKCCTRTVGSIPAREASEALFTTVPS